MAAIQEKTSEILLRLAEEAVGERVALSTLVEMLGDRSFGILLCLWALPCAIPIPGISTPFGLLIILTGIQMILGLRQPWLPKFVTSQSMARADFMRMLDKALPYVVRMERYCRPRMRFAAGGIAERLLGIVMIVLGGVLVLPILGGNLLPAIAIVIMALGIIEHDGVAVVVGVVTGVVSLAVVFAIIGTAIAVFVGSMRAIGINF